ncbi:dTDP-4-dehydrorhamnose reductase [Flavisolibacter ginsengisoli]|jgi:dTDP-4-dehydrorhamnose reductase|uniref:dTDP-4-dehydrorhamnose reductase n=1 Tax=Flavisolibacter ginsengisoli DSM 18119 TaxID=1121884 RepID=A0A1M5DSG1_9BACT|nr:dTDP-4-dehydrorhamnose reductase [Flavisolibacter ginsengisoli]SHF69712.1 dTDP-4-dehydrorhamnose reductase [Flavisolibacter ginsengisoli DSM 18119]
MSDGRKILVSGSNGQLGSELQEIARQFKEFQFVFFSRAELSITDRAALEKMFILHRPSYFINCAAYTAVDKAEKEKEIAEEINGHAVGAIATLCSQYDCRLIHISTDYVFNGKASTPLKEDDPVDPVNAYGDSKLLGERLAMQHTDAVIIRTSWVYSKYGNNFVKTMKRLMGEKESISVVHDQVGSPTYAADLATAIMEIITSGKWEPGIYNYSNSGVISWFDFANEIKIQLHSKCEVYPIPTSQFPTPAKRPAYSVLDKEKIQSVYHIKAREWKESLKECIDKLG